MTIDGPITSNRWVKAWPDALAFGAGLAIAWFAEWETTDLVWSLWLSSLVVGYAMIVWTVTKTLREFISGAVADRTSGETAPKLAGLGLLSFGALFMLAFFTVHFGGFHLGHSIFLSSFFPIHPGEKITGLFLSWDTYAEVFRRYWIFLPAAFIAERAGFFSSDKKPPKDDGAVTVEAIAKRKARNAAGGEMMAPYKNVIRMHLLIFFFAGASFAKLDSFIIYAVVYAVYFFPWKLLKKPSPTTNVT